MGRAACRLTRPRGRAPVPHSESAEAAGRLAFRVAEGLRDRGFGVTLHAGGGSFKAQMKRADVSGAHLAVIIGEDEAAAGEASIKLLRETGEQVRVAVDRLPEVIHEMLYTETTEA
jgi:histidyl-tRNA synthetase